MVWADENYFFPALLLFLCTSPYKIFLNRHLDFVWSFARLLGHQMDIQFPPDSNNRVGSLVDEALANFSPAAYFPSDKEVIVDPTMDRPVPRSGSDKQGFLVDGQIRTMLKTTIERLGVLKCMSLSLI